jgi:DNA-binding GntR family transcriptional regulator
MTTTKDDHGLVDRLAAAIQSRVLSGELPTGTRLRQESLAAEFGVSRTPVREALRQLNASGVVTVQPNRGAVVRGPSPREIREAYAVRAELEGFATELAAAHLGDVQLDQLREAERLFRHSIQELIEDRRRGVERDWTRQSEWERANDLFHRVIQEAAGNIQLQEAIAYLHLRFPRDLTWAALSHSSHLLAENVEQHQRILEAIEARDPERARHAMTEHVRAAGELVARLLEQRAS